MRWRRGASGTRRAPSRAGWGDLKLKDETGKVKTHLEMLVASVGARQEVLTGRRINVVLKAVAFLTELEAGADDRLPKTAGDAQPLRLMMEGRTAWAPSKDSHVTPVFEVGVGGTEARRRRAVGGNTCTRSSAWGSKRAGGTCWCTRGRGY